MCKTGHPILRNHHKLFAVSFTCGCFFLSFWPRCFACTRKANFWSYYWLYSDLTHFVSSLFRTPCVSPNFRNAIMKIFCIVLPLDKLINHTYGKAANFKWNFSYNFYFKGQWLQVAKIYRNEILPTSFDLWRTFCSVWRMPMTLNLTQKIILCLLIFHKGTQKCCH